MKKLLVMLLVLGSFSSFAQRYGGNTYYGYGKIVLAWEKIAQTKVKYKENVYDFPYVEGTTEVELSDKYLCINGVVTYGNKTTTTTNEYYLPGKCVFDNENKGYVYNANLRPATLMEKSQFTSVDDLVRNAPANHVNEIETSRCVKLKKLRKQMNKWCKTNKLVLNGHEVELNLFR